VSLPPSSSGVGCFLFSLNLFRKLHREEEPTNDASRAWLHVQEPTPFPGGADPLDPTITSYQTIPGMAESRREEEEGAAGSEGSFRLWPMIRPYVTYLKFW
jgi:hypothetical protein